MYRLFIKCTTDNFDPGYISKARSAFEAPGADVSTQMSRPSDDTSHYENELKFKEGAKFHLRKDLRKVSSKAKLEIEEYEGFSAL
jgi:hypothetical protein